MNGEKLQKIQSHARAIAALLYDETAPEQLTTLAGIEAAVRGHVLEHVSPEMGVFLLQPPAAPAVDAGGSSKASLEKSVLLKTRQKSFRSDPVPN